jgi:hypothetical protein
MASRHYASNLTPWERGCAAKTRWATDFQARARAHELMRIPGAFDVRKIFTYQCEHCGGWHLTKDGRDKPSGVTAASMYAR